MGKTAAVGGDARCFMSDQLSCFDGSHYVAVSWMDPRCILFRKHYTEQVRAALSKLAFDMRCHAVGIHVYPVGAPNGCTAYIGLVALLESHIAVHSWPEARVVQLDFYSCMHRNHQGLIKWLKRLGAERVEVRDVSAAHREDVSGMVCVESWTR